MILWRLFCRTRSSVCSSGGLRVGCDLFFVVLGFILGGTVGAGTIVAVFLTGPLVQFWLPKTKKAVQTVLQEE